MPEGLPERFRRAGGELATAGDLAAALRRAAARGETVKDEEETLLLREDHPEVGRRWWKLYRVPSRRRAFAWLGRSRARREFAALRALAAAGLPAAPALAWAEERRGPLLVSSLLVTGGLAATGDLAARWRDPATDAEERLRLAAAAGRAAARLHEVGFGHFRMQLRNLVEAGGRIHWLDAPFACRWPGPVPDRIRAVDLADLAGADSPFALAEAEACLLAYAAVAGRAPDLDRLRRRGRLGRKVRRVAWYLLAVNGGRRIPLSP
ncbi:MAG: hypothetical protein D6702_10850 [Planctomycetota bacterium]|nr:MAG: hypothetical protein D6702_10850 [Planctomycetota bacterium]